MAEFDNITTFSTMAEQLIDLLEGGDPSNDSRYDERVVARWLRQSANKLMAGGMATAWANGQKLADPKYIATFNDIDVKLDTNIGENYSDLPVYGYFSLPNHAEIQRIAPKIKAGKYGDAMIPINPHEMDIYRPLDAGYLEGQLYYEPDRFKVWYGRVKNKTLLEKEITAVQIKMISIDPLSVKDDDPLPISEELQSNIIQDALQMLAIQDQQVADYLANTNPNVQQR